MPRMPLDDGVVASGFATKARPDHFAYDVVRPGGKKATAGAQAHAPEAGTVIDVYSTADPERGDNTRVRGQTDLTRAAFPGIADPWDGYGPGGVLIQGDSGAFHLLAHLATQTVAVGDHVAEGDIVGTLTTRGVGASDPHVHWEVRTKALSTLGDRAAGTMDPGRWLAGQDTQKNAPAQPKKSIAPSVVSEPTPWWLVALGLYVAYRLTSRSRRR